MDLNSGCVCTWSWWAFLLLHCTWFPVTLCFMQMFAYNVNVLNIFSAMILLAYVLTMTTLVKVHTLQPSKKSSPTQVCPKIVMQRIWPTFNENTHTCVRRKIYRNENSFVTEIHNGKVYIFSPFVSPSKYFAKFFNVIGVISGSLKIFHVWLCIETWSERVGLSKQILLAIWTVFHFSERK